MNSSIRSVKSMIASTHANDNCHPASNNCVGLISRRIIAANDNVLTGLACRRNRIEAQKTQHMTAALIVGALGGTISRKMPTAVAQMTARVGFIKPAVLEAHQIIPKRIPMCIPERLIKCSSPVLRKARYVSLSISRLSPSSRACSRSRPASCGFRSPIRAVVAARFTLVLSLAHAAAGGPGSFLIPSLNFTDAPRKTFLLARWPAESNWPGFVVGVNLPSQQ